LALISQQQIRGTDPGPPSPGLQPVSAAHVDKALIMQEVKGLGSCLNDVGYGVPRS
jgi:hypothetical protein